MSATFFSARISRATDMIDARLAAICSGRRARWNEVTVREGYQTDGLLLSDRWSVMVRYPLTKELTYGPPAHNDRPGSGRQARGGHRIELRPRAGTRHPAGRRGRRRDHGDPQ